ncbi:MAG: hypothetical protein IPI73_19055 [Betaproteobacteria bacterium]|nr:hypothetical protein [Betaproteobacteria bacterium]
MPPSPTWRAPLARGVAIADDGDELGGQDRRQVGCDFQEEPGLRDVTAAGVDVRHTRHQVITAAGPGRGHDKAVVGVEDVFAGDEIAVQAELGEIDDAAAVRRQDHGAVGHGKHGVHFGRLVVDPEGPFEAGQRGLRQEGADGDQQRRHEGHQETARAVRKGIRRERLRADPGPVEGACIAHAAVASPDGSAQRQARRFATQHVDLSQSRRGPDEIQALKSR